MLQLRNPSCRRWLKRTTYSVGFSPAYTSMKNWRRTGYSRAAPHGNPSCQGKIPYRGPIAPRGKNIPNIKLDLTADEHLAPGAAPDLSPL